MKNILIVILLLLTFTNIYGDNLSKYQLNFIKVISSGNENGYIGHQNAIAGRPSGPTCMAINEKNEIYVPDRVNKRINIYDENLFYLRKIIEQDNTSAYNAINMKVDNTGNIYYSFPNVGLIKIDNKGKLIYKIEPEPYMEKIFYWNDFFILNENLFFYTPKGEIQYIDKDGNVKSATEAVAKLSELSGQTTQSNNLSLSMGTTQKEDGVIEELLNSKQYLLDGYNFYSTDINKTKKFFSEIKEAQITDQNSTINKSVSINNKNLDINIDDYDCTLYGYDSEHNSYWGAGKQVDKDLRTLNIIIFDKFGNILDGFQYGELYKYSAKTDVYPTSDSIVAIAPNGDVYFMVGSSKKYTFYKVTRQW